VRRVAYRFGGGGVCVWRDLREGHHLGNLGVDGRVMLKWIKKWYREVGSGLIWLWIGECGGHL